MSSKARWTVAQGLAFLRAQREHPTQGWENLCLHLYTRSRGFTGGLASASAFSRTIPAKYRHYGSTPPRGSVVLWETNGFGHIATSLGGGYVLCNVGNKVAKVAMSYYAGLGRSYWADGDAPIFGSMVGNNGNPPTLKAKPAPIKPPPHAAPTEPIPVVKTLNWPLEVGGDYKRISKVKAALDWPNTSTHYGADLAARVKRWERHHPEYGPPDGRIGPKEYDAILSR